MIEQNTAISDAESPRRKKPQYSEKQRKKHIQDYRVSQLSIEQYSQLSKISQSALRKWIQCSQQCIQPYGHGHNLNQEYAKIAQNKRNSVLP